MKANIAAPEMKNYFNAGGRDGRLKSEVRGQNSEIAGRMARLQLPRHYLSVSRFFGLLAFKRGYLLVRFLLADGKNRVAKILDEFSRRAGHVSH